MTRTHKENGLYHPVINLPNGHTFISSVGYKEYGKARLEAIQRTDFYQRNRHLWA